ncbi:MAG: hypothetical protein ABEJ99_05890 [Candidatus Nanohaloarchaea archaeon]
MDKTVEIVMVVMVALASAAIVLFLLQGRAGGFNDFMGSQSNTGKCSLWQTQYQNSPSSSLYTKAQNSGCAWATSSTSGSGGGGTGTSTGTGRAKLSPN